MPRLKTFYVGVLNIKIHPHSPEKYQKLFWQTFNLKKRVNLRGNDFGMIGTCFRIDQKNELAGYQGTIYKFFDLDPKSEWFNITRNEEATQDEIESINIPENLKPHSEKFMYLFIPQKHKIFVITNNENQKTMSINTVAKFFYDSFNVDILTEKYGEVDVIVEQSRENLENMLNVYRISTLNITLSRPNPDDLESQEDDIRRLLEDQNSKKMSQSLIAQNGLSITPNEITQQLAKLATSNGSVEITGKDENNETVVKSTVEHPFFESFKFDSKKDILINQFKSVANQILEKLKL